MKLNFNLRNTAKTLRVAVATAHMSQDFKEAFPNLQVGVNDNTPIDLLILTGGADLYPGSYGQAVDGAMGWNRERDRVEFDAISVALRTNSKVKVLGVCRGLQLLNVYFGGDLVQDLGNRRQSHEHVHKLEHKEITALSWLQTVNSLHHQALNHISENPSGRVIAIHPEYKNPEIVSWGDRFLGVQFHPEMFGSPSYDRFFDVIKEWVHGKVSFLPSNETAQKKPADERLDLEIKFAELLGSGRHETDRIVNLTLEEDDQ